MVIEVKLASTFIMFLKRTSLGMFSRHVLIHNYYCRDHFFDHQERKRLKGKKKEAVMSFERNAVERGTLGVRYEKARRNESKLLPTDRMGLNVDDEGFVRCLNGP